ncbi:uncharacterized protein LOC114283626 [Camellia sinensis]|uniref:uncharacterized protein LOC114283626 n=1 Tax=Camellia sinensis TaxID=4442 RepID=UPI0010367A2A|nr:uncharacterized protein LOC114283626 [Camellia sinensis]
MTSESNKKDSAWQYAHLVKENNLNKFECNFCGKVSNGGVYRVKQHLAGGFKNVTACSKCPAHVREETREFMSKKKTQKEEMNMLPDFDDMDMEDEDEDDDVVEINVNQRRKLTRSSQGSSKSKSKMSKRKGPMDVYFTPNPESVMKNQRDQAKGKQTKIDANDPYKKDMRAQAVQRFARWMYDAGIPVNAVNYESFGPMIEAIGQYGPGMKPPTYHEMRVTQLKKEVKHTKDLMKNHKEDCAKYKCSIMTDGWTDKRGRALINLLVNCPRGTMFVESVDASSYSKDGQKLFELLGKFAEKVGKDNVVQVITDSVVANVLAGRFLEAKYEHLYWTPCTVHCLDLMLEDIFKIPRLKKTFERVSGPLVKVLRLVDTEKKPPMGYIYEAMDRAKKCIASSFDHKEERYNEIFEIIDKRWDVQLHRPLHAVAHFLNPEFFYPRALQLHSKKRNKLERLNDLVFVKYNKTLRFSYDMCNTVDPISLQNIDETNE